MALPLIPIFVASGLGMIGAGTALESNKNKSAKIAAQNSFNNTLNSYGLSNLTVNDALTDLYYSGKINKGDYSKGINLINSGDITAHSGIGNQSTKQVQDLYKTLSKHIPELQYANYNAAKAAGMNVSNLFGGNVPTLSSAPAPSYFNTNFKGTQMDVDNRKLWTGKELANLHDLDFDMDSMYNAIKQGTEAQVDYGQYVSDNLLNDSLIDTTNNRVAYLDSLRSGKEEAIAKGATAGQRAANELLANVQTIADFTGKQAEVATNRFDAVNDALLADAEARLTARQRYDTMAQGLSTDSMSLYSNDTERYGAQVGLNAAMYAADQALRAQYAQANASMSAAQKSANASIAGAQSSMNNQANQYQWVFDRYLGAANGDVNKAVASTNDWIFRNYTGTNVSGYLGGSTKK